MTVIKSDNPITASSEDTLGRDELASSFAAQIQSLDYQFGAVVGVLGPWGSGKTSFVNLTLKHLGRSEINALEFNPWMFSGAEQLLNNFFEEISSQLELSAELSDVAGGVGLEFYLFDI
jgi:predicted KAP-like P-loop ATPase